MLTYTIIILKIFFIKIKTIKTNKNEIAVRNLDEPIINCEEFKDCFNCSACGPDVVVSNCLCYWSHNKCQNVSFNPILNWKDIFMQCEDDSSNQIKNTYCGNFTKTSKKNKMNLKLPKINGYYGLTNLFCEYFYINNQKQNTEFKITVSINSKYLYSANENNVLLGFKIYYNDNTFETITITTNSNSYSFIEVSFIQISYLSSDSYNENPFEIDIEYKNPSVRIGIYIIFIIIILCVILCGVSVFYFSRRASANARIRDIIVLRNNNNQSNNNDNEENKKKVEELLNNPLLLGERICLREYEKYGTNCTICLEELKVGVDKVSLTPCFHVFHFKCLSDWLRKNVSNLKCPNCNCDLTSINNESNLKNNDNDINKENVK